MFFIKEVFVFVSFFCFLFMSRANVKIIDEELSKQNTNLQPGFIASLFPNVSPYLKFSVTPQTMSPDIREYLKWEKSAQLIPEELLISTIIQNTGISYKSKSARKKQKTPVFRADVDLNWFGSWQHKVCTSSRQKSTNPILSETYQKYNQIPGSKELGNRERLWKNAKKMIKKHRSSDFPFFLQTFVLPKEFPAFKKAWAEVADKLWIVKSPEEKSNASHPPKVISHWTEASNTSDTHIVQKYLHNPYIHQGNKIELRFYTLLTSVHPLRFYISYSGIGSTKLTSNTTGHIKYQLHNSKDGFEKLFNVDTKSVLKEKIEDAIIKTFLTTSSKIRHLCSETLFNGYNAYQLFSFDFLLDDRLNLWLNKINTVPIFGASNSTKDKTKSPSSSLIFMAEVLNVAGYHLPPFISARAKEGVYKVGSVKKRSGVGEVIEIDDPTFQAKLYSFGKSDVDQKKTERFEAMDIQYRRGYLDSILESLTPKDVRQLVVSEDELHRASIFGKSFKRILPSPSMHKYLRFIENGVYEYMLQDAWETRLMGTNRTEARKLLSLYTRRKIHLS